MGKFYSNQPNQNIIMQRKLEKICGLSDEQILREFEKAQKNTCPLPIKPPPADEFERICRRVGAERRKILTAPQRVKWKRVAAVGLLAAALTGSGCFVALGKKSYFYREREARGITVLNNDSNKVSAGKEELAYQEIEDVLGIKVIHFGYKPYDISYEAVTIDNGTARIRYSLNDKNLFVTLSKYESKASLNYKSNYQFEEIINNRWMNQKIKLYSETLSNGTKAYEALFVNDGIYFRLTGMIDREIFVKILESLTY